MKIKTKSASHMQPVLARVIEKFQSMQKGVQRLRLRMTEKKDPEYHDLLEKIHRTMESVYRKIRSVYGSDRVRVLSPKQMRGFYQDVAKVADENELPRNHPHRQWVSDFKNRLYNMFILDGSRELSEARGKSMKIHKKEGRSWEAERRTHQDRDWETYCTIGF